MRLWHQLLIPKLPRQQLLGQHRECCALRGNGWGKSHSVVNYVFEYPIAKLENYHFLVMEEMERRGYKVDYLWWLRSYRGKSFGRQTLKELIKPQVGIVYQEHDDKYYQECVANLKNKGIDIIKKGDEQNE